MEVSASSQMTPMYQTRHNLTTAAAQAGALSWMWMWVLAKPV